jgi:predicted dehydrogenase
MPFRMRYLVEFEGGVADFDLGRTPPLLLHGQQGSRAVSVAEGTGYDHQAAGVVRAVARGTGSPVPLAEAVEGLRLIEAERRSLVSGAWESVSGSQ